METKYTAEPEDKAGYTRKNDQLYTRFAGLYDLAVRLLPVWKRWIGQAIGHIQGERVLEISFGTGYLLTQYAGRYETYGIDYNQRMVSLARKKLAEKGISADLRQGNVEALPYEDEQFDTVVNTMAFSGYPDAEKAMSEITRVLKRGGRLVMVDINYPLDGRRSGTIMANFWAAAGDLLRDMGELFQRFGFDYTDEEIGGFGSVHLYLAEKPS